MEEKMTARFENRKRASKAVPGNESPKPATGVGAGKTNVMGRNRVVQRVCRMEVLAPTTRTSKNEGCPRDM